MSQNSNITIDEYIIIKALKYPSLYGSQTFEQSKLSVLDHLLSTIGNGISFSELLNDSLSHIENKNTLFKDSQHLFDGTPMFYVSRVITPNSNLFREPIVNPKTGEEVFSLTMNDIKEFGFDDTSKYYLVEKGIKNNFWRPYPGFQKTFSILWGNQERLKELPTDFLEGFIDYYKTSLDFFTTDKQYSYHYACPAPKDEAKWTRTLIEWQEIFEKNTERIENIEDKYKKFSTDYETSYDGDMRKFLENKHKDSINKIVSFIHETISLIENAIEEKNNITPSSKPRKKI